MTGRPEWESSPGEDPLDQDVAGHEITEDDTDGGQDGYQCIAQAVSDDDGPIRHAGGPGCANIVGVQYIQHGCPDHLGDGSTDDEPPSESGEGQVCQGVCEEFTVSRE